MYDDPNLLEAAKALLAEAGYADGFELELSLDTSSNDAVSMIYQIIQQQLAEVGITANIVSYDESSWLALRKSGEMGSFVSTWTADYGTTVYGSTAGSSTTVGAYYTGYKYSSCTSATVTTSGATVYRIFVKVTYTITKGAKKIYPHLLYFTTLLFP